MRRDEWCDRRAAAGEAGAAYVPEREPIAETACVLMERDGLRRSFGRSTICRGGSAGRGMAFARPSERYPLASAFDPRRSLGSHSLC